MENCKSGLQVLLLGYESAEAVNRCINCIDSPAIISVQYRPLLQPGITTGLLREERLIDAAVKPVQPCRVGGHTCLHIISP